MLQNPLHGLVFQRQALDLAHGLGVLHIGAFHRTGIAIRRHHLIEPLIHPRPVHHEAPGPRYYLVGPARLEIDVLEDGLAGALTPKVGYSPLAEPEWAAHAAAALEGSRTPIVLLARGRELTTASGQPLRISSARTLAECSIWRMDKTAVIRALQTQPAFSEMFMAYLLARNIRIESDLIDHLFNSSEKRLARLLLLLANFGKEGQPQPVIAPISQETLAEMIGTTRARVSFFMNRFRRLGFIEYNGNVEVHSSLLSVVLLDDLKSSHSAAEN